MNSKEITGYKIIVATSFEETEARVKAGIKAGWQPFGNPSMIRNELYDPEGYYLENAPQTRPHIYMQAIVKYEE